MGIPLLSGRPSVDEVPMVFGPFLSLADRESYKPLSIALIERDNGLRDGKIVGSWPQWCSHDPQSPASPPLDIPRAYGALCPRSVNSGSQALYLCGSNMDDLQNILFKWSPAPISMRGFRANPPWRLWYLYWVHSYDILGTRRGLYSFISTFIDAMVNMANFSQLIQWTMSIYPWYDP